MIGPKVSIKGTSFSTCFYLDTRYNYSIRDAILADRVSCLLSCPLLGQVLPYENIKDIIKFCKEEKLVLLADEVNMSSECNISPLANITFSV